MQINGFKFGEIDLETATFISAKIEVNGKVSQCNLYVDENICEDKKALQMIELTLETLDEWDQRSRQELLKSLNGKDSTVADFIEFHLDELGSEVCAKIGLAKVDQKPFMSALELCGVAFHKQSDGLMAVFDYSIGTEISDALLAVKFSNTGVLLSIAHES
jgi:Protein of unknown function (DUF2004)